MAKSRSKISRQPVRKIDKAAARAGGAAKTNPSSAGASVTITAKPAKSASKAEARLAAAMIAPKKGRWVYAFGGGKAAGRADMRNLLGGKGAGLAEMAHLGVPVRTLRRKLRDEETSFRDLFDQSRAEVAIKYLRDTEMTVDDIAHALGFSETANFRHAFRRWNHASPQEVRRTLATSNAN